MRKWFLIVSVVALLLAVLLVLVGCGVFNNNNAEFMRAYGSDNTYDLHQDQMMTILHSVFKLLVCVAYFLLGAWFSLWKQGRCTKRESKQLIPATIICIVLVIVDIIIMIQGCV